MDLERTVNSDPRRNLPSVDRLIREVEAKTSDIAAWAVRSASRSVLEQIRDDVSRGESKLSGKQIELDELVERVATQAERLSASHPRAVINATGVLLHTNLG